MLFFRRKKIAFDPIDPLDNGLREEIAAERLEPDHFELSDQIDVALPEKWDAILADARQDPDFTFADDEA